MCVKTCTRGEAPCPTRTGGRGLPPSGPDKVAFPRRHGISAPA
jgi:hypothetical protein